MRNPIHPFNGPGDTSGTSAVEYFCDKCNSRIEGSVINQGGKHFHTYCARTPEQLKDDRIALLTAENSQLKREVEELKQNRKWHHELLDTIYEEMPDGMNERPDPRQLVREWRKAHGELAEAKAEMAAARFDAKTERGKFNDAMVSRGEILAERDSLAQRLKAWRHCAYRLAEVLRDIEPLAGSSRDMFRYNSEMKRAALAAFEKLQKEEPKS